MAELALAPEPEDIEADEPETDRDPKRDKELCRRRSVRDQLIGGAKDPGGLYSDVESGFIAQADRSNNIMDFWDAYKSTLGGQQYYNGNSKIFFPIIATAIRARMTRFTNQCFPQSGRYIDVTTANGDIPYAEMAMMEHYVRRIRLKNTIVKPLFKNGDIEGNYSVYVDWKTSERKIAQRAMRPVMDGGQEMPEFGEVEDITYDEIEDAGPDVEIIADSDLLILPVTAKNPDDAIAQGGSVTVRRRFTKAVIKTMIEDGDIDRRSGEDFMTSLRLPVDEAGRRDTQKKIGEAAGIRVHKGMKVAVVAETWAKIKVDGERVLCRTYFGGDDIILGCKRNPYWNDRVPVVSEPVDRDAGMAKGRPPVADVMGIQIAANDMVNESVDVSNYAAMPIVAADPEANSDSSSMVLGLGAVWDIKPDLVRFLEFPALYEKLLPFIERMEQAIFQTLGVNPAMLPGMTGKPGAKKNQAEAALEQQVDVLSTAESTSVMEDVLNQVLLRWCEYDHQFRDKPITVKAFGPMGRKANMESVGPLQLGNAYEFVWLGVESARNAAAAQQMTAALATLMKIPPAMLPGFKLDLSAAVNSIALTQFGPRIAPLTLVNLKDEQGMDPAEEDQMLAEGFDVPVHPTDDDPKHIADHMAAMQREGDERGAFKWHIAQHNMQRQAKAMAAQQQQAQQGGGGRSGQAGSQPKGPQPGRGPGGMIPPDQISGPSATMPRRMA